MVSPLFPTDRACAAWCRRLRLGGLAALATLAAQASLGVVDEAHAVTSAELYRKQSYRYGKFEARINFPAADGVVASFFLWKDRSELATMYWNELDFEKIGADCELQLNSLYGLPESGHESTAEGITPCDEYHTYAFEWTPDYIAWLVDGTEVRRDTGADAQAFADNATEGMQFRFNIWPGTPAFGGTFSPDVLPLHQYINWVRYSEYTPGAAEGDFTVVWHESFDAGIPAGYSRGSWGSPLGQSTHSPTNVAAVNGVAVLSLTEDGAAPYAGTPPVDPEAEPPGPPPPMVTTPVPVPAPGPGSEMPEPEDRGGGGSCGVARTMPGGGRLLAALALAGLLRRRRSTST